MTPRECFRLATAIQAIATASYPVDDSTKYPNEEIAFEMGKIAGLAHKIKTVCLDLDPALRPPRPQPSEPFAKG